MSELDPRVSWQRYLLNRYSRRHILQRGAQLGTALGLGPLLAACGVTTETPPPAGSPGATVGPTAAGGEPTSLRVLLANHTGFYAMVTPEFEQANNATIEFTREQFGALPSVLTPAFEAGGESWDVVYLWRAWV